MVVPEFPQSISSFGGVSTRFFPWTTSVLGSGCSILIPKARRAFTVRMQSSLGRKPRSVHGPFESAAIITARWEMLLSPGTVISVSIRGARLTRNSIDQFKKISQKRAAVPRYISSAGISIGDKVLLSSLPPAGEKLWNEKDFSRVWILHLRARRESLHIDVLARRERTFDHVRFAGNRNSIRMVSLFRFGRHSSRSRSG